MKTKDMPPLNILFADDDADETYLFNEALEHAGINFILSFANDGNSLIALLKNNPLPDVVFIDINMPYKDGLEVLTEIRMYPEFSTLPIIIYSTVTDERVIDLCYQNGADLFVIKPNNFDEMVQVVKRIIAINWKNNTKSPRDQFVITE